MKDILGLILSVIGTLLAIGSAILVWRKKLLQAGFDTFKETYRVEMDLFKETVTSKITDYQKNTVGYINKNEERHTNALNQIIDLFQQTKDEVASQTSICKVIQARREGATKFEDGWKKQIEQELDEVRNDVKHIKKVINHENIV